MKTHENAEKVDLDKSTECEAPICESKNTTLGLPTITEGSKENSFLVRQLLYCIRRQHQALGHDNKQLQYEVYEHFQNEQSVYVLKISAKIYSKIYV